MVANIEGPVIEGRKMGRQLGFPTANVALKGEIRIDNGVYLSRIKIGNREYDAVTNIGTNPTIGEVEQRAESYILEFDEDIYGQTISINLGTKLRGQVHFDSVEALRQQILKDIEQAYQLR